MGVVGSRIRYEFASIELTKGWVHGAGAGAGAGNDPPTKRPRRHPSFTSFVIGSPRGEGVFEIDPIADAIEDPSFDLAALRERIQKALDIYASLTSKPFDCTEWHDATFACFAYTVVWRVGEGETNPRAPLVQRQWHLVKGADTIVVSYKNGNGDDVAPDIVDCEEMVRSIRFERDRGSASSSSSSSPSS